jgi:steroid delta-isomerase-like uncharacterized protein
MAGNDLKATFTPIWDGVWHSKESAKVIAASYSDDFKIHISSLPTPIDRSNWIQFVAGWQKAYPDGRMEIRDVITDGDKLWCFWTSTGTHSAEYLGIPATGKRVEYQGVDIYRFRDGKIAECWAVPDVFTLLRQLGAIPS